MRSVPLSTIIDGVAIKNGDDAVLLQTNQRLAIVEHINDRLAYCWDYFPFPEWTRREVRTPVDGVIPLESPGQTRINQVLECHQSPDASGERLGSKLTYAIDQRGIIVPRSVPFVAVTFTEMPPIFTGIAWAAGTYLAGSLVYHGGDTFTTATSTAAVPPSQPWVKVPFPYILARAVKTGAAIDLLREDGQNEKALAEEVKFIQRLDEAVETVTITQNQRNTYAA
jgi:hypothetical protein